jgi:hypothetical protein
VVLVVVLDQ